MSESDLPKRIRSVTGDRLFALLRPLAFGLILVAIIDKNRSASS